MSINDKFIYLDSISKNFGNLCALKNVSMELERNKITSLVGNNGSGKSTLIKILSGSLRPDRGTIYIEGKAFKHLSPKTAYAAGISTVYQDLSLDNYRNTVGNIFLGRELTRFGFLIDYKSMEKQAIELLKILNVDIPHLKTPVGYLSGGQRQSIAISRSILQGEKLIVLDEPTAAMGIKESTAANKLISSLTTKGYTVLMISHNLNQVYDMSDRIFIMRHGEIVKDTFKSHTTLEKLKCEIDTDEEKDVI